jgi:hypothetical protein
MAEDAARAALEELEKVAFFATYDVAKLTSLFLVDKFNFVSSMPSLQLVRTGGLVPYVPYHIMSVSKSGSAVCVHWPEAHRPNFFLPICYAEMVSNRDVAVINSGVRQFTMVMAEK